MGGLIKMLSKYHEIKIDDIKKEFDNEVEDSIKILLCNLKLERTMDKFSEIITCLKEEENDENIDILSQIANITNEDLCEFISNKSLAKSQRNKCAVELYESFESSIKNIIKYIYYKKPRLTFNKMNENINGETIYRILENNGDMDGVIKECIDNEANKWMYSKNIEDILKFVCKHSKSEIEENNMRIIKIGSNTRNVLVHNKGKIDETAEKKLRKLSTRKKFADTISVKEKGIKLYLDVYKNVIYTICEGLKSNLEESSQDFKKVN